ncbi:MAG: hypothetical protein K2H35_05825 [Muribaculaceae bacterium]|nr:hypothetical protein [Muribaculaceae bacterium]MDE6559701.1 hypothetical protein [Muribaculaceae bacterium]
MKRFAFILIMMLATAVAYAKPPKLNIEQFFDGRYNKEQTVTTSIIKENGNYFRSMVIKNNPGIIKQLHNALTKDKDRAEKFFEQTGEGGTSILVKIASNGEMIDIGFQQHPSGKNASLFIKGSEKAFK